MSLGQKPGYHTGATLSSSEPCQALGETHTIKKLTLHNMHVEHGGWSKWQRDLKHPNSHNHAQPCKHDDVTSVISTQQLGPQGSGRLISVTLNGTRSFSQQLDKKQAWLWIVTVKLSISCYNTLLFSCENRTKDNWSLLQWFTVMAIISISNERIVPPQGNSRNPGTYKEKRRIDRSQNIQSDDQTGSKQTPIIAKMTWNRKQMNGKAITQTVHCKYPSQFRVTSNFNLRLLPNSVSQHFVK